MTYNCGVFSRYLLPNRTLTLSLLQQTPQLLVSTDYCARPSRATCNRRDHAQWALGSVGFTCLWARPSWLAAGNVGGGGGGRAGQSDPVCSHNQPPTAQPSPVQRKGVRFLETYIQALLPPLYYACSHYTHAFNI